MSDNSANLQAVINAFAALSGWEVMATVLGIIYVILAAKESVWCWPAGFLSTLIYTVLFWEGQLPMQALLNFYYMGMAVYGFVFWSRAKKNVRDSEDSTVVDWPWSKHLLIIPVGIMLSMVIGYYLSSYTETRLPYLDAIVMVFSMIATWLLAHKILQTWIYWIVIDSAAIGLYWQTGYYVTIILFVIYIVLSFYGYKRWKNNTLAMVNV